jgi:hypothetical protein
VDDGAVADVGALFQTDGYSREHVDGAILLHIATVFNYNASPISSYSRPGSYVNIFTYNYIAGNRCLRMHKCRWMNNWNKTFETIKQIADV